MQCIGGSRKLSHCPSSVKHQESPGVGFSSQVKSGAFWAGALDLTVSVYSERFNSQPHTPAIHMFYTGKDGLTCSHLKKRKEKKPSNQPTLCDLVVALHPFRQESPFPSSPPQPPCLGTLSSPVLPAPCGAFSWGCSQQSPSGGGPVVGSTQPS